MSSTGESIVINKSKRSKFNIPSSPIKTTPLENTSSFEQTTDNLEQNHSKNIGVTAIVATIRSGPELRPKVKANNIANQKLVVKKS